MRRSIVLGGLLSALLIALGVLAAYPVAEMGVIDDWSYTRTALDLVRTGHVIYNGWATAMLGWQILWGALFIKLFGYSMLAVRMSTLPLAMACAFLMFSLSVRCGLNWGNALLATCTVVLSPVFVPLAASYMTDVPGLLSILFCLYCCVRALDAETSTSAISCLAVATVAGVIGGTCRQIAWLAPLVMVPSAAWLLRKKRGVLPAAGVLWILALCAVFGCTYWFAHQPYSVPEKLVKARFERWLLRKALEQYRDIVLTVFFFCLPVLVAYLTALRRVSRRILLLLLACSVLLITAAVIYGGNGLAPFMINIVTPWGVHGDGHGHTMGDKPVVLGLWIRLALTSLLAVSLCAATAAVFSCRLSHPPPSEAVTRALSWKTVFSLFLPFAICYFILLAPRAVFAIAYDRYIIPVFALLLIVLLRFYQERVREKTPVFCFVILTLFFGYAIASTHDFFAMERAQIAAVREVLNAGVPRTELQAGFELDGPVQVDTTGYMNDPRIETPPDAYKPAEASSPVPEDCRMIWSFLMPAIHPRYFVAFSPQHCLSFSGLPPVTYSTWLPPFQRKLYIQQLRDLSSTARHFPLRGSLVAATRFTWRYSERAVRLFKASMHT